MKNMKILDASAILHSDMDFSEGEYYITNTVLEELRTENAKIKVEDGILRGIVKIIEAPDSSMTTVREAAEKLGELHRLSPADLEVLAAAHSSKGEILSDDYAIQNVAALMGIKYHMTAKEGIKKKYAWEKLCRGCGAKHPASHKTCRICGSQLRAVGREIKD